MPSINLTNEMYDTVKSIWKSRKKEKITYSQIVGELIEDQKKYKKIMEGVN